MPLKKEYTNGELTIVWKPELCQHAGVCVKMLPEVYNPKAKPWINAEDAPTQALKEQISRCPSGALTYYFNAVGDNEELVLVHNQEQKRFEFHIGNFRAFIEYILTPDKIVLTHTEVPVGLEGMGVASALIKATLLKVEDMGLILVPLCPFVAGYIKKHPEWKKLVMRGINIG